MTNSDGGLPNLKFDVKKFHIYQVLSLPAQQAKHDVRTSSPFLSVLRSQPECVVVDSDNLQCCYALPIFAIQFSS